MRANASERPQAPVSAGPAAASAPASGPPAWRARAEALRRSIDAAADALALARVASAIAPLAGEALDAGAGIDETTAAISALNDAVTVATVQQVAAELQADLGQACWLVFGSQARGEQTIATDQDNGLVFLSQDADRDRPRWLAFGQRVNQRLAACGYPLCSGNVMAGQPLCCLLADEWCARFAHWLAHGSGNDLFGARLYFDLRPLAGRLTLAAPLQALLRSPAARVPRFLKQMADSVLAHPVPLDWLGRTRTQRLHDGPGFDLKMNGTALFVDAARLWALAQGVAETGTAERLRAVAPALRLPPRELAQWLDAFHALQRLRLQVQRRGHDGADPERRCLAVWAELDDAQRHALNRALRTARWVQQRLQLDFHA